MNCAVTAHSHNISVAVVNGLNSKFYCVVFMFRKDTGEM